SDQPLPLSLPQKAGGRLWLPMLVMALMGFAVGIVLAVIRANEISNGGAADTIAALGQFVPAAMFLGFAAVFAAISFAIARILGGLRTSGGAVQQSAGAKVETLRTPKTAKAFIAGMALAMMTILVAVVIHVVVGAGVLAGTVSLASAEQSAIWLEGVRRIGVAIYLFAIALGLGTIIHVLRFQAIRIRELPGEAQ
ncbi:MAG: hypothetical protein ACE5MI_10390, partial [Acidimicrobiia bacterium]